MNDHQVFSPEVSIPINPMAVAITDRGSRFRIKDEQGYAHLGSCIWLPFNDFAIITNITCNGLLEDILLTYGLIEPDGFVYDAARMTRGKTLWSHAASSCRQESTSARQPGTCCEALIHRLMA